MILLLIIAPFFLDYAALIIYYAIKWTSIKQPHAEQLKTLTRFSIVIPARNEERNISELITALQQQDYLKENYEIIVVDDGSTDDTVKRLKFFQDIKCIELPNDDANSGKKRAIETGIAAAQNEWIVTTDADCKPGTKWLATIAGYIGHHKPVMVAGPVHMRPSLTLLGVFQEMDFMILQAITGAAVSNNRSSMCNGANLVYQKKVFYEVEGFKDIDHIASGDDMLLMYKIWKKFPNQVVYLKSKQAIVETEGQMTWKDFFNQRIRWASKARSFQDRRVLPVLIVVYLFNLSFLVLTVAAIIHPFYWKFLLLLLVAKTLVELPLFISAGQFFGRAKLLPFYFIFQPLHILYTIVSGLFSQLGKYEWKGRRVR